MASAGSVDSRDSGGLANPLACGVHLCELAATLSGSTNSAEIGEVEVRLNLWPHGRSAVVAAQFHTSLQPLRRLVITSAEAASATLCSADGSLLPFLKPLLGGRTWRPQRPQWPQQWGPPRLTQPQLPLGSHNAGQKVRVPLRALRLHNGNGIREQAFSSLPGVLVASLVPKLAANYPLWTRSTVTPLRRASKVEVSHELLFPPTTGPYSSLDSIAAGEVSLPPSYQLPPVPSQVLVLGIASLDGRAIGVPALRKPQIGKPYEHMGKRMGLHPMLAEHLLVAGGSDAWRRDVAGSLVSQALEMGMTVIAVDGGSPPDEPPSTARKRSRIVSADMRRRSSGQSSARIVGAMGSAGSAGADPLSPIMLRLGDPALVAQRVAQIDMDNPAGSVHPNMLYVSAPPWLPPIQGEATALSVALQTALVAQMRFLQGVNATGMDMGILGIAGIVGLDVARIGNDRIGDDGPGAAIIEAWLTVLLLRHHRARLLLASRDLPLFPVSPISPLSPVSPDGSIHRGTITNSAEPTSPTSRTAQAPFAAPSLPSCPDLPSLMVVLEQSDTLLRLLRRERAAWSDPEWISLVQGMGGVAGEHAVQAAHLALERASLVEHIDPSDMFLYGAALRGQLKRVLGHSAMMRMLSGPHVSLADLLHGGAIRMLRVNLSGAYRTVTPPHTDDDLARKHYGLYLLWSLWAMSQQSKALNIPQLDKDPPGYAGNADHVGSADNDGYAGYDGYIEPNPMLLMLHGAGAWFGSGSPLSEPSRLEGLGREGSGIALAVTVSGLRHLRAYRARACEEFGNLIMGPAPVAPVADMDAPDVTLHQVEQEMRLLRDGMRRVAGRLAHEAQEAHESACTSPLSPDGSRTSYASNASNASNASQAFHTSAADQAWKAPDGDHLLTVLRHIEEGSALVVTGLPGGRKAVCTAHVGSGVAGDVRNSWAIRSSPSSHPSHSSPSSPVAAASPTSPAAPLPASTPEEHEG